MIPHERLLEQAAAQGISTTGRMGKPRRPMAIRADLILIQWAEEGMTSKVSPPPYTLRGD